MWCLPLNNRTLYFFLWFRRLIMTWSDSVSSLTCVHNFCILLFNQFAFVIFFVAKDIIVRWNWWCVGQHDLLLRVWLYPAFTSALFSVNPFYLLKILAWSRNLPCFFIFTHQCHRFLRFTRVEPLLTRGKICGRLNYLNAKLFKSKSFHLLRWLHILLNFLETARQRYFVLPRSYIKLISSKLPGVWLTCA